MKITSFAWNRHCSKHEMCWFWLKMVGMSHFQTSIWPLCYRLISDTTTLQRFYGPATFYQNHAALEHVLYIRAGMQMQGGAFFKSRHSWSKIVASSSLVLRHPRRNWKVPTQSPQSFPWKKKRFLARLLTHQPLETPLPLLRAAACRVLLPYPREAGL